MSYLSDEMCREIILDHVTNPRNANKSHVNYLEETLKNPSCGDLVTIWLKLEGDKISDITYEVEGCSICSSSTSMMSSLMQNKTIGEAKEINENFSKMMLNEEYDKCILEDAQSLRGVSKQQPRIKCATLCYKALLRIVGDKS